MDQLRSKRKRKGTKTYLTVSKKSRRYRLQRQRTPDSRDSFSECSDYDEQQSSIPDTQSNDTQTDHTTFSTVGIQVSPPLKKNSSTQFEYGSKTQGTQTTNTHIRNSNSSQSEYLYRNLLDQLNEKDSLLKFSKLLHENEQTDKFVKLIHAISSQKLMTSNISWKAALDMGALSMCTSTTNMSYDKEWLEFCQVLYHMFGGGVMHTLRGRAHFSHVTSQKNTKRIFKPYEGEFNFPVPSVPTLKKIDIGYSLDIPVGIIQHSMDLAEERSKQGDEFILSFDGKLVSPGCKDKSTGDCDMWGREGPPNLRKALKTLEYTLKMAQHIDNDMKERSSDQHCGFLEHLLYTATCRLKRLRQRICGIFYLRKKLIANVGDNEELRYKYRRRMSTLNHNTAECESVVRRLLDINIQITKLLAHIRKNNDVHVASHVRHITLSEQTNFFSLIDPEIARFAIDLDDENNSQYIKQGTPLWHQQRAKARVTGSTLRSAIGLDTLMKQKEHYYVYVNGRQPPPPSPHLQQLFDHGKKNEVNATATLVSTAAPALLPDCFALFEVGPKFLHSQNRHNIMEVSADGLFMCTNGRNCQNYDTHRDRKILVEIKSPFPSDENPETVYYEVPHRHVPQILAEMKAYDCSELWLVCSIQRSCTVISVTFDQELWGKMWDLVVEFYDLDKPKMQTRVHSDNRMLRLHISEFSKRNSVLLCEIPTVTGEIGNIYVDPSFSSPFSPNMPRPTNDIDLEFVLTQNKVLSSESTSVFTGCHEVLRIPGKELLVFMLTNKDRKQNKHVPYSYPIAYAMKGSSMTNADLQFMVRKLRNILLQNKIPILCEAYDGQWHNHITESERGEHLTRMHCRATWSRISKLSKDKCIEELSNHCIVKSVHRDSIAKLNRGFRKYSTDNIKVEQKRSGKLSIGTCSMKMSQIISVTQKSRPDLFLNGTSVYHSSANDNLNAKKKRKKAHLGLLDGERDIYNILVQDEIFQTEDDDNNEDFLPDLNRGNENLENLLLNTNCPLMSNILTQLRVFNSAKWDDKTGEYMYTHLLTDAHELTRMCTLKELNIIATELRCFTGRIWFSSNNVKAENVNIIVSAFNGVKLANVDSSRRKEKRFQPDPLVLLACCAMKIETYPVEHLQISLGTIIQRTNSANWVANKTCPLVVPIPHAHNSSLVRPMELFCYPEMSAERHQLEPRTFDFTHILTNIRNQILTRGFDYCRKEHFQELCTKRPDILSIALVYDKIDTQNAFTAMKMFNYSVERWMNKNGYTDTAKFVRLVRNWHDACNRRGLSADTRVRYLHEMHVFMTSAVNFNAVPSQFADRYIHGMTWQTFEALLQNISTRIQLYYFSSNLTYNARAVSTLSNESFFADLVRYDKESHGYPKGVNVRKVFGRVVLINYFKHKRDRNYFLSATIKGKYEIKLAEHNHRRYIQENSQNYVGLYRNHFFDFPNELTSHRVRREDITTGLASLRTNPGVRIFFRTNEGTILPETRGGRQVKGFTLEKNVY